MPLSKARVRSFFFQVCFLSRFVPNFSEIVKCIFGMMKGDMTFKWSDIGKRDFEDIKGVIAKAPILIHPNYTKEFIIYCYASEHTMPAIVMQENKEGT